MGHYFDKRTKKFIVRTSVEGKRIHVGSFDTETEALIVSRRLDKSLLDKYKLYYEKQDAGFKWLNPLKAKAKVLLAEHKQRKAIERQNEAKLRSM